MSILPTQSYGVQTDMSAAARDSLTFAAAKNAYFEGNKVVATSRQNYLDAFTNGYNRSEALYYRATTTSGWR